jgi:ribonuclease P protein component
MSLLFPKSEKLKSTKTIERLFEDGRSITEFPVKLIYIEQKTEQKTQAAFAVPKRNFKSAVDRNRIKRQLREAYRLHKQLLSSNTGKNFALLFLYIGKNKPEYVFLEKSMRVLLKKLRNEKS